MISLLLCDRHYSIIIFSSMLKFMCYLLIGFGFYAYRCSLVDLMIEMDRILWPEGTVVVRDTPKVIDRVAKIASAIR